MYTFYNFVKPAERLGSGPAASEADSHAAAKHAERAQLAKVTWAWVKHGYRVCACVDTLYACVDLMRRQELEEIVHVNKLTCLKAIKTARVITDNYQCKVSLFGCLLIGVVFKGNRCATCITGARLPESTALP